MDTVLSIFTNNSDTELINKIKNLEEKITILERNLSEKECTISEIENNMKRQYVDGWIVTDSEGIKGNFSGNIYWIKGDGILHYKNGNIFEGDWDSIGEIVDGTLSNRKGEILRKWDDYEELSEIVDNNETEEEVDPERIEEV